MSIDFFLFGNAVCLRIQVNKENKEFKVTYKSLKSNFQ